MLLGRIQRQAVRGHGFAPDELSSISPTPQEQKPTRLGIAAGPIHKQRMLGQI
jgi:hypothetical protein